MTLSLPLTSAPTPVSFLVPGDPQRKARPRTFYSEKAKRVFTVTKDATKKYEQAVHAHAQRAHALARWPAPDPAHRFALRIELHFATAGAYRRDIDNVAKAILDGMNGVFYADDFQITSLAVWRVMASADPGARILISRTEEVFGNGK